MLLYTAYRTISVLNLIGKKISSVNNKRINAALLKTVAVLFLLVLSIDAGAQQNETSAPFNLPSPIVGAKEKRVKLYKEMIGELDGYYFSIRDETFTSIVVTKYDSLLRPVKELTIATDNDRNGNRRFFYSVELVEHNLCLLTSTLLTNINGRLVHQFEIQYIDPDQLSYQGEPQVIESIEYDIKKEVPAFSYNFSKDHRKFVLISLARITSSKDFNMNVWVKDKKFAPIWNANHKFQNPDLSFLNLMKGPSCNVESSGEVIVPIEHKSADIYGAYSVYRFFNSGMQQQTITIPKEKWQNFDLFFSQDSLHNLIAVGSYSEKDTDTIGTAYFKMHLDFPQSTSFRLNQLTGFLSKYRKEKENSREFFLSDILSAEDDNKLLIYEYFNSYKPRHGSTHYTYGNLLIVKLDPKGNVLWKKLVHKTQRSIGERNHSSYHAIFTHGDLYLVYNQIQEKKNYITRISASGELQQQELFELTYYPIMRSCSNSFDDKMLLLSEARDGGSEEYWIALDFNNPHPHGKIIPTPTDNDTLNVQPKVSKNNSLRRRRASTTKNWDLGCSVSFGTDCFRSVKGNATANFPYQQVDLNTQQGSNQQASFSKNYSSKSFSMLGFGMDYLYKRIYAEGGFEIPLSKVDPSPASFHFVNLYIGSGIKINPQNSRIGVRIGARLLNSRMKSEFASIGNYFKTLVIDNQFYAATYGGKKGSPIYNAGYTELLITQRNIGLAPRLGLEYCTKNNLFIFRLNVSYNYSLQTQNRMYLVQTNAGKVRDGNDGHEARYNLANSFSNYQYTGASNTNAPFSSNNFVFSFQVVTTGDFWKKIFSTK